MHFYDVSLSNNKQKNKEKWAEYTNSPRPKF